MVTFGNFWQLLCSPGYFWLISAAFGYLCYIRLLARLLAAQHLDGSLKMEKGLALKQKMVRLGLAKINKYSIREIEKGGSKWLNAVSKCQCKIVMNSTGVFLREKSSNGCWVNSNKVDKDHIFKYMGPNRWV